MKSLKSNITIAAVVLLTAVFFIVEVQARSFGGRAGGGGGFSRGGIGSHGGFSGRGGGFSGAGMNQTRGMQRDRTNDARAAAQDRQDSRRDRMEDRQDFRKDRMEDRQDFTDDNADDWDRWDDNDGKFLAGAVVGGAVVAASRPSTNYITTLPCSVAPVTVSGAYYYDCGGTWYQRAYAGSQITYIAVAPPPGY